MLIIHDQAGRYLFVKRLASKPAGGHWCPVSGTLEPGESQEAAVVREAYEEVALTVRPIARLGESPCSTGDYVLHWWSVEIVAGSAKVAAKDEIEEIRWVKTDDFASLQPQYSEDTAFILAYHHRKSDKE